jgi:electron transport complex protein RnfC
MLPLKTHDPSRDQRRAAASAARERYHFHLARIERDKREKTEKLMRREKPGIGPSVPAPDAQMLIQAALERAKAQAAAVQPKNTGQLSPDQQAQIDEIRLFRS